MMFLLLDQTVISFPFSVSLTVVHVICTSINAFCLFLFLFVEGIKTDDESVVFAKYKAAKLFYSRMVQEN